SVTSGVGKEGDGRDGAAVATAPASPRDDDVTDVSRLAASLAASATGDPDWVEVFSRLRARSWLATRYPGRYDLSEIYRDEAAEVARANEKQNLTLGVYLDEPLPRLVSVTKTRDLGELVELEVVLDAGPATVRGEADDLPRGVLPGGTHRGLFTLGRGPDDAWHIHSVTELLVGSRTTGQEPH
ncbi:MAG: hypothetical protein OEY41_11420, partial [Acidimicrobiia bacterium]|nr:hypothetical protein [Acidimicrobiia bacterium]